MNVFDEIIDFDIVNICQRKKKESITQKPHHMHIIAWHFVTIDIVFCVVVFFTSKHITIQKFQSTKDANEFLQLIVYQMLEVLIQTIHWFRHTGNWEANKINIWTWLACLPAFLLSELAKWEIRTKQNNNRSFDSNEMCKHNEKKCSTKIVWKEHNLWINRARLLRHNWSNFERKKVVYSSKIAHFVSTSVRFSL